VRLPSEGK